MDRSRYGAWALALVLLVPAPASVSADAPLADAAERGDRSEVCALIGQHVDVDQSQADGMTALHWAAHHDDPETVRLLVNAGADVRAAKAVITAAASERGAEALSSFAPNMFGD